MNKKIKGISPGAIAIISMIVFIIPVVYYVFGWVPGKKVQLSDRYLRILAMMSEQLEAKGESIVDVIKDAKIEMQSTKKRKKNENPEFTDTEKHQIISWVESLLKPDMNSINVEMVLPQSKNTSKEEHPNDPKKSPTSGSNKKQTDESKEEPSSGSDEIPFKYIPKEEKIQFIININVNRVWTVSTASSTESRKDECFHNNKDKKTLEKVPFPANLKVTVDINDFIKDICQETSFDDVFILDERYNQVYRQSRREDSGIKNGIILMDIENLFEKTVNSDNQSIRRQSIKSKIKNITIGNKNYLVFIQPIPLKFAKKEFEKDKGNEQYWFVCGLLSIDELNQRSRRISGHLILLFLMVLALAFIGYPFIKHWLIGTGDRFRIRDILLLLLTLIAGIPVITYSIISITGYYAQEDTYEKDLRVFANNIYTNFVNEIQAAHDQLKILEKKQIIYLFRNPEHKYHPKPNEGKMEENPFLLKALARNNELKYPYFHMAFVINKNGKQEYKRHTTKVSSRKIENPNDGLELLKRLHVEKISFYNVSQRRYFQNIKNKDYWYTPDGQPMSLEAVRSKSSGIFELNLAIPTGDECLPAAGISFRPLSVIRPVLPPNHGFAIVEDESGKVIFHSDPRMNLIENFFSECDDSRLKPAFFAGGECRIKKVQYKGQSYDFYVKPLPGIPWTLVAFRNRLVHSSRNIEKIYRAFLGYFFYTGILILVLFAYSLTWFTQKKIGGLKTEHLYSKFFWIWPHVKLQPKYTIVSILNILTFSILLFQLYVLDVKSLNSLLLPAVILIPIYLGLMKSLNENLRREFNKDPRDGASFWRRIRIKLRYRWDEVGLFFLMVLIIYYSQIQFIKLKGQYGISFIIILLYLWWLFIRREKPEDPGKEKNSNKRFGFGIDNLRNLWFYRHSHIIMLYTLLLLLVAYPALLFYKIAQHEEVLTFAQYQQLNLAKDYIKWKSARKKTYGDQEKALVGQEPTATDYSDYNAGSWGIYTIPEHSTLIMGKLGYEILMRQGIPSEKDIKTAIKDIKTIIKDFKLLPPSLKTYQILHAIKTNNEVQKPTDSKDGIFLSEIDSFPIWRAMVKPSYMMIRLVQVFIPFNLFTHLTLLDDQDYQLVHEIIPYKLPQIHLPLYDALFRKAVDNIMPIDNEYSKKAQYLYEISQKIEPGNKKLNLYWESYQEKKGTILSRLTYGYNAHPNVTKKNQNENQLIITSAVSPGSGGVLCNLICVFLLVGFLTIALYLVVRFIVRIIFLQEMKTEPHESTLLDNRNSEKEKGKFFIYGKATKEFLAKYKGGNNLVIDCTEDDFAEKYTRELPKLSGNNCYVLVINLDYKIHDAEFNLKKLQLLEDLIMVHEVSVAIFSRFEPLQYFHLHSHSPEDKENGNGKKENGKSLKEIQEDSVVNRWNRLLSLLESRYIFEGNAYKNDYKEASTGFNQEDEEFLRQECAKDIPYLWGIRNNIITRFVNNKQQCIDLSALKDRIYEQAQPIYDSIWWSSTRDEKLAMLQLARYGLLNIKSRRSIRKLLQRGLINLSPLRLMNRTFTEYVLAAPDNDAIIHWKKIHGSSRWASVKKPFFFLSIGLTLFLVITQPDLLKSSLLIVSAVSASLPSVLKLVDTITGDKE